jgi:PadR family transcriptional regulator PadR
VFSFSLRSRRFTPVSDIDACDGSKIIARTSTKSVISLDTLESTIHSNARYMAMTSKLTELQIPHDRWEVQLRKGTLDMAALASLWHGRLYGLEIIRYLETHSQLVLAEGTIYPILNRLKAEGLLASEWVEAEAGHPRKYYSLTDAGRQRLCSMAEAWVAFSRGLGYLLKPVLKTRSECHD